MPNLTQNLNSNNLKTDRIMIRKVFPLLLCIMALTACQKDPDMSELSDNLMVYTNYDNECDFSQYKTFYVPDSVLVLDNSKNEPIYYSKDNTRVQQIILAFENEMESRGYVEVDDRNDADLGVQLTYIRNTNVYVGYNYPYWWYDFYYYWPFAYWDPFFIDWYPFYPYPVTYSYTTGTLAAEIIALKDIDNNSSDKRIPFVWTAIMSGIDSGNQINQSRALSGIYQAFDQSPYINTTQQ